MKSMVVLFALVAVACGSLMPAAQPPQYPAVVLGPDARPLDTAEVINARAVHLQAKALEGSYAPLAYGGRSTIGSGLIGTTLLGNTAWGSPLVSNAAWRSPLIGNAAWRSPLIGNAAWGSPLLNNARYGAYGTGLLNAAPLALGRAW